MLRGNALGKVRNSQKFAINQNICTLHLSLSNPNSYYGGRVMSCTRLCFVKTLLFAFILSKLYIQQVAPYCTTIIFTSKFISTLQKSFFQVIQYDFLLFSNNMNAFLKLPSMQLLFRTLLCIDQNLVNLR